MAHTTSDGPTGRRASAALPAGGALVAVLLGVAGVAWLVSARLATPDMRLGVLTGASTMSTNSASSQMGMPGAMSMGSMGSMGLGGFIATWAVMMVAMMVPSFVPAVRRFDTRARTEAQPGGATVPLLAGYLLLWSAVGGIAYLAVQAFRGWLSAGSVTAVRSGAVLLIVAGVYQLTPPKQACLRHCRSAHIGMASPVSTRAQGYLSAARAGLWQGAYCLGSSWPLMLVLLLVGMMNLAWMGVVAAVIFMEKVVPAGDVASKVVGWGLAGCGVILLAAPHTLPALGGA
jgi:predicted metal-binding membrane protein